MRLHPPWGLKTGLGLPASGEGGQLGAAVGGSPPGPCPTSARMAGSAGGSPPGPSPTSARTAGSPTRYLRRSAAPGFVLDQPGLLLGLAEVWLHQWLESSAFSREALIEG